MENTEDIPKFGKILKKNYQVPGKSEPKNGDQAAAAAVKYRGFPRNWYLQAARDNCSRGLRVL